MVSFVENKLPIKTMNLRVWAFSCAMKVYKKKKRRRNSWLMKTNAPLFMDNSWLQITPWNLIFFLFLAVFMGHEIIFIGFSKEIHGIFTKLWSIVCIIQLKRVRVLYLGFLEPIILFYPVQYFYEDLNSLVLWTPP